MSNNNTTWDIEPHTQAKHQILEEYLKRWFPILSSASEKIVYLDGFAGPGTYSNGEDGSPIIAIKTALDHRLAENFKNIFFRFIEKNPNRAENLKRVIENRFSSTLPKNFKYKVDRSQFEPKLENILDEIESEGAKLAPTFAFIDPFGFSGMPMSLIARILQYEKCEVLITFMSSFVNRFNDEMRENALDDLFGSRDWREIHEMDDPDNRRRFLLDFYLEQLRKCGNAQYCRTFEMIGGNNQTVYYLVFATKNIAGLKAMKEAMFKIDKRGTFKFSDRTDPGQTLLLDYSEASSWTNSASKCVYEKFAGKTVGVDKVEEFVLVKTPFVFRKAILINLEKENKIENVIGRKKTFAFPEGCTITFSK